jgi:hypothetical protein
MAGGSPMGTPQGLATFRLSRSLTLLSVTAKMRAFGPKGRRMRFKQPEWYLTDHCDA